MAVLIWLVLLLAAAAAAHPLGHAHTRIRAASQEEAQRIADAVGATLHDPLPFSGFYSATLPPVAKAHPNVRIVHPVEYGLHTAPSAGWNLDLLDLPRAWETTNGTGTRVMVIDAGATLAHPDLATVNASAAWNVFYNNTDVHSPNGIEHGTEVASVVVGVHDDFCATGAAPGTDLVFVKLIEPGAGLRVTSTVLAVVLSYVPPGAPVDVISLSIGPSAPTYTTLEDIVEIALEGAAARGSVIVWSAGNGGEYHEQLAFNEVSSHVHVLAVGACGPDGVRLPYSTTGGMLAFAAPSAVLDHETPAAVGANECNGQFGGTSRAAPEVASIVALVRAVAPGLTPADVADVLIRTASGAAGVDPNAAGLRHSYDVGFGVPNATRALAAAAARTERLALRRVVVEVPGTPAIFLNHQTLRVNVSATGVVFAAYAVLDIEMGACSLGQTQGFELTSPSGTVAPVLRAPVTMYWIRSASALRVGTRAFHGEPASGEWAVDLRALCAFGTEVHSAWLEVWVAE